MNYNLIAYRGLFSLLIVYYHYYIKRGYFVNAYLAVDFFFILSGFLLMGSFIKDSSKTPYTYFIKRFKLYFPIGTFMLILYYFRITKNYNFVEKIYKLPNLLYEAFFLHCLGLPTTKEYIYSPYWYISCILIVGFLIYNFLYHFKQKYVRIAAPLIIVLSYTVLINNFGNLADFRSPALGGITTKGFLRALGSINIGCLTFELCDYLSRTINIPVFKTNVILRIVFFIGEMLNLFSLIFIMFIPGVAGTDFIIVFNSIFLLICAWLKVGELNALISKSFLVILGELSFYIYLCHVYLFPWTKKVLNLIYKDNITNFNFIEIVVLTFMVVLFAAFLKYIVDPLLQNGLRKIETSYEKSSIN